MALFHGLSAFPITPTNEAGVVNAGALERVLERLHEVDSVGLLGSTGQYAYLTRGERRRAVEVAVGCLGGRVPVMVGVGAVRTDEAVALVRDAAEAGADGLLLAPVSYAPLTEEEVFRHFSAVAASTDLPVCIYHNPATTHFIFSDSLVARLAAVKGIVAVKHPAPAPEDAVARVEAMRRGLPAEFAVGFSVDWHAADAVLAGGVGWYSVVGGVFPEPALALMRGAQAGDVAEVRRIGAAFAPLWGLFRQHGSFRVVYAMANVLGLTDAQPPLPVLPLEAGERARVARALEMVV